MVQLTSICISVFQHFFEFEKRLSVYAESSATRRSNGIEEVRLLFEEVVDTAARPRDRRIYPPSIIDELTSQFRLRSLASEVEFYCVESS